ncbi:hypothetical protein Dtox_3494 [Desulfofarcimen acetoxidans DSM 771]|uniref:Uncharacterized protein n=1 Tax=Desulfofarcimen acetoxidans (strain ATCC 49208 / DSM 771 / KCTC 5769 / VKM B-1644 / 5575) TaxID=485916 RepID=C8W6V4_DESAS|nr:hypothetical protein [Desulfofarcimen acetoxidans]ACV64213.1 hypothetical protein Dtox_3494 [Desulfofarcimen acetoxidans DSM 771]
MKKTGAKILGVLMVLSLVLCLNSAIALANTGEVSIYLGNNANSLATYDTNDLEGFGTTAAYDYSSYNCKDYQYHYFTAYGPELEQVLTAALNGSGVSLSQITSVKILDIGADGTEGTSDDFSKTISKSDLFGTRYYIDSNQNYVVVPAIIATEFGDLGGTISSTDCLRNFYGQTSATEAVMGNWVKNISKIRLYQ